MQKAVQQPARNVLGGPLLACCHAPRTGFYRDGYCRTEAQDIGRHVVCVEVTQAFLAFSRSHGNDLSTPKPEFDFPGLQPGDRWCLCALRWREALDHDMAPPVILEACDEKALAYVTLEELRAHAIMPSH